MCLGECLSALVHFTVLVTSLVNSTYGDHFVYATRLQVVHGMPMQMHILFAYAYQASEGRIMQIELPI